MKQSTVLQDVQKSTVEARREKEKQKSEMLNSIYSKKHEVVVSTKKQSEKNDIKAKSFKEKVVQKNTEKSQKIKEQEELLLIKKKEALAEKLIQNKLDYEKRLLDEEILKKAKEAEVLKMEQLEMELIKRLQHTQGLQKTAYEELENALAQPPEEYAKKYFPNGVSEDQSPSKSPSKSNNDEPEGFSEAGHDSPTQKDEQPDKSAKIINDQEANQEETTEAQEAQ